MFDTVDQRALTASGRARAAAGGEGRDEAAVGGRVGVVRRNSTVDISPLVAATLALWGYSNSAGDNDWRFY